MVSSRSIIRAIEDPTTYYKYTARNGNARSRTFIQNEARVISAGAATRVNPAQDKPRESESHTPSKYHGRAQQSAAMRASAAEMLDASRLIPDSFRE